MRLFRPLTSFFAPSPFRPASSAFPCFPPSRLSSLSASAHPVSSSIPTYSISRPSAQVNIIPAWFPSLSETSARAVFIFRASVAWSHRACPRLRLPACPCSRSSACAFLCPSAPASPVSPVHPCQPRAVRTRGVFTHRDDFGKPACVERGLVRTAMFHGPVDVPRMGAPVMERAGSSGNARIGSHLAATDAAKGHAGQVDGPGSSGNAVNGSHLAAADFSDEPRVVMWRHTPPRRTESGLLLYGTPPQDSAVQKTALWCTRGSS